MEKLAGSYWFNPFDCFRRWVLKAIAYFLYERCVRLDAREDNYHHMRWRFWRSSKNGHTYDRGSTHTYWLSPNGAVGVPAVYEMNGREYILFALNAGPAFPDGARMPPGGVNPPAGPKAYVAFALPRT